MNQNEHLAYQKLFTGYLNSVSSPEESAAFLLEDGINPEELLKEGLRKIKQIKMNIAAEETESHYKQITLFGVERAKAEVDKILSDSAFSILSFIKSQNIQVSYRNFEEMTSEETRAFLERHFLLKFERESKTK